MMEEYGKYITKERAELQKMARGDERVVVSIEAFDLEEREVYKYPSTQGFIQMLDLGQSNKSRSVC